MGDADERHTLYAPKYGANSLLLALERRWKTPAEWFRHQPDGEEALSRDEACGGGGAGAGAGGDWVPWRDKETHRLQTQRLEPPARQRVHPASPGHHHHQRVP